jgi:hypothetical protein
MIRVDIGIAANKQQNHQWWNGTFSEIIRTTQCDEGIEIARVIVTGSAMTDISKNMATNFMMTQVNTAENRTAIVGKHLNEEPLADAIWWIDDDTVPPLGALRRLIDLETDVAAGIYYLRNPPYNPVAYRRHPQGGGYTPLFDFQPDEIRPMDSVGMGCTLVKRYVYERIMENYVLFSRHATHTIKPVHKDDILETGTLPSKVRKHMGKVLMSQNGVVLLEELRPVDKVARWPFYIMEYERTEDHFFCEMVKRLGMDIVLDTSIECEHWGWKMVTGESFRRMREEWKAQRH